MLKVLIHIITCHITGLIRFNYKSIGQLTLISDCQHVQISKYYIQVGNRSLHLCGITSPYRENICSCNNKHG